MKSKTPLQIFNEMKDTYGDNGPSVFVIRYWVRKFKFGFPSVQDDVRPGRPADAVTDYYISKVKDLVFEDRRITINELVRQTTLSRGTVGTILHEHLKMTKVCARWIPLVLTLEMREERKRCSTVFLEHFRSTPHFFDRLVTVDETWVYLYDPEMKYQSMEWKLPKEPSPKKVKASRSAVKVMLTVFWDAEGIILTDFLPEGTNMNKEYYSDLIRSLKRELVRKRRNKLRKGHALLLQDNAPPHRAGVTMATIEECGLQLLEHPPYSPDLAPSDFFLFPEMKRQLKGRRFEDRNEICAVTEEWLLAQPPHFYFEGLFKVKNRWQKCISLDGGWVEK